MLKYPKTADSKFLENGFKFGFSLHYTGPRLSIESKNLRSITENIEEAKKKINQEIELGRIFGPYIRKPISNLRCSPIGIVPKKSGGSRLITHLSYPEGDSVNDFIDPSLTRVNYSNFDSVVNIIQSLGRGSLIGKMDIKSAFRLLPCRPGDFDLLGFKFQDQYYIDKCMPMGCSISCSTFEKFSTFLQFELKRRTNSQNIDHYLDDFFFAGSPSSNSCQYLMDAFTELCNEVGVPIADDKTEGPTTCLTYLGYQLDTEKLHIQIPSDKVVKLLQQIFNTLQMKKVRLKELQSLTGSLAFCARAMPSARAFIRRLYSAMSGVEKSHYRIRLTKGIKDDLFMWQQFLTNYNGISYMLNSQWLSNNVLELYTDSAGGTNLGCGVYFQGKWAFLQWPKEWSKTGILSDITFLELVPIFLAIFLWKFQFKGMRMKFSCDNQAVVQILNTKSSRSERVMSLVREIVLLSLRFDFHINAVHIPGTVNKIADSISRMQWEAFKTVAPQADPKPTKIPQEFWKYLPEK